MVNTLDRWGGDDKLSLKGLVVLTLTFYLAMGVPFANPLVNIAGAADLYVDGATGTDTGDCQTPSCQSITYALTQADAGDVINVAEGTYDTVLGETFPIEPGDGVSLIGAGAGDNCGDPGTSCIHQDDISGSDIVIRYSENITDPGNTRLENFTIENARADASGIKIDAETGEDVSPVISTNTITGNGEVGVHIAGGWNGGIASPTLSNNTITGNGEAGVYVAGGWYGTASPTLSNNTITGNGFDGVNIAGVMYGTASPTLSTNTITGNGEAGVYIVGGYAGTASPTMSNNTITGNDEDGVVIYGLLVSTASPVLENNTITGNQNNGVLIYADAGSTANPDLGGGGASIGHNTIRDNADSSLDGTPYDNAGYYDVNNDSNQTISAEANWWGATPPNIDSGTPEHIHNDDGGIVDQVDADPSNDQDLSFTIWPLVGLETGGTTITISAATKAGTFFVDEVGAPTDPDYNIVVTFGGNPATNVVVNAAGTHITAVTPAGTGAVDVVVTNPGGQTGILAGGYTYIDSYDQDGDGYDDMAYGGDDCDDTDPEVNPGVEESQAAGNCEDGIDNDCDRLADTDPECQGCFIGVVM